MLVTNIFLYLRKGKGSNGRLQNGIINIGRESKYVTVDRGVSGRGVGIRRRGLKVSNPALNMVTSVLGPQVLRSNRLSPTLLSLWR